MKRPLTLAAAVLTAAAAGCGRDGGASEAVCVDQGTGQRVDDSYCNGTRGASDAWLWFYLARAAAVPPVHTVVVHHVAGSFTRPKGTVRTGYPAAGLTAAQAAKFRARSTVPQPKKPATVQKPAGVQQKPPAVKPPPVVKPPAPAPRPPTITRH